MWTLVVDVVGWWRWLCRTLLAFHHDEDDNIPWREIGETDSRGFSHRASPLHRLSRCSWFPSRNLDSMRWYLLSSVQDESIRLFTSPYVKIAISVKIEIGGIDSRTTICPFYAWIPSCVQFKHIPKRCQECQVPGALLLYSSRTPSCSGSPLSNSSVLFGRFFPQEVFHMHHHSHDILFDVGGLHGPFRQELQASWYKFAEIGPATLTKYILSLAWTTS